MTFKDCLHNHGDNNREFAGHKQCSAVLDADISFTHPYSSWEQDANENAISLLR